MALLAPLLVLAILAPQTSGASGDAPPSDLELASLVVTDGIVGGIIAARPRVRFAAAYDRDTREFQVVRRETGAEADEAWNPPGSSDIDRRGCRIRLSYGTVQWANGAPGGCVHGLKTEPNDDERRRFDEILARLEHAVDELPARRCGVEELQRVPFLADVEELEGCRRVPKHVLADPVRHGLDLERVYASASAASCCRRLRCSDSRAGA